MLCFMWSREHKQCNNKAIKVRSTPFARSDIVIDCDVQLKTNPCILRRFAAYRAH